MLCADKMLEKILLAPYYLTLKVRHALYDKGIRKVYSPDVPTVCVGNITAGGTGKTPHTEMILRTLLRSDDWGMREIAVLSRGHRRRSKGFQQVDRQGTADFCGDEPLQIKKKFPGVTVAVDRDRVEGCRFLTDPEALRTSKKARKCRNRELRAADVIVLDDAFQYRALKADFNIVLIDWNRPIYKDRLLPFGRLRDLPERLREADVVIVTKCPVYLEDWERIDWLKPLGIRNFNTETCEGEHRRGKKMTVLFTSINYCPLTPVYPESGNSRYIYSKMAVLFSGIARDTPLRRYLSDRYRIVRRFAFSDHHRYSAADVRRIAAAAKADPTAVVVTTEKDAQRIRDNKKVPENLRERMFQVPIEVSFLSAREKEVFEDRMLTALRAPRSAR